MPGIKSFLSFQKQIAGDNAVQIQALGDVHIYGAERLNRLNNTLGNVCKKQISAFLLREKSFLNERTQRLSNLYSHYISGTAKNEFFSSISEGFPGCEKPLLSVDQKLDIERILNYCEKYDKKIVVSTCTWFVGAIAILGYMKEALGVPINIDFKYAHSGKTALDLKDPQKNSIPHLSIIADGPSSYVYKNYISEPRYTPISYAPPCEHRVVLHKDARKWYRREVNLSGEYHVVFNEDLVSTPKLHLDTLVRKRKLKSESIKIVETDPGGQLPIFLTGASETRSIFCDPQWQVISLWHPNAFIVSKEESFWSDVIIHSEEEFRNSMVCDSFLRLFHGSWYDIKYNIGNSLYKSLDALYEDTEYIRLLLHYCGLR